MVWRRAIRRVFFMSWADAHGGINFQWKWGVKKHHHIRRRVCLKPEIQKVSLNVKRRWDRKNKNHPILSKCPIFFHCQITILEILRFKRNSLLKSRARSSIGLARTCLIGSCEEHSRMFAIDTTKHEDSDVSVRVLADWQSKREGLELIYDNVNHWQMFQNIDWCSHLFVSSKPSTKISLLFSLSHYLVLKKSSM